MGNLIPKSMKLYVGGYPSESFNVYLDDEGKLTYESSGKESEGEWEPMVDMEPAIEARLRAIHEGKKATKSVIKPSQSDWEEFRSLLDKLRVWDWQKSYLPRARTMDGTRWAVSIEYEDCQIESKGSNAYPNHLKPEIAHGDDMEDWVKFREGVSRLVEGKAFW